MPAKKYRLDQMEIGEREFFPLSMSRHTLVTVMGIYAKRYGMKFQLRTHKVGMWVHRIS